MQYKYTDLNEVIKRIQELESYRAYERRRERDLKARSLALKKLPEIANNGVQSLEKNLQGFLPSHMFPSNIGPIDAVTWPFWSSVDFDFGTDPSVSTLLTQTQSFQVSQEAGLMIMGIYRDSSEVSLAGSLGPWQVVFRDAQSSRQLNDKPMIFQNIGFKSNPTVLPTPYFLLPNAKFEVVMSGANQTAFTALGEAQHQICFMGYRVRVQDAQNVLSTIFSQHGL